MSIQEKIRHDIYTILRSACEDCAQDEGMSIDFDEYAGELTDIVLECEKAQGVVIIDEPNESISISGQYLDKPRKMHYVVPLISEVKDV